MSKDYIMQAQRDLNAVGIATLVDGDFGAGSLASVRALIDKAGLEIPAPPSVGNDPAWVRVAKSLVGTREIKGPRNNSKIMSWYNKGAESWFVNDEIPWCGKFVAQCLDVGGRSVPKHWYRALAYLEYGTKLSKPALGAIGVKRRKGGGHVTFIVGQTEDGYLVGLGGNQSDQVRLTKFKPSVFAAYIWPAKADGTATVPRNSRYNLPIYDGNMQLSTKES